MVRMNITLPDDVGKELKRIRNKSGFIAATLRERFILERKHQMAVILDKAYQKAALEDKALVRELDNSAADGID